MLYERGFFIEGQTRHIFASFILCPIEKLAISFCAQRDKTVSLTATYYEEAYGDHCTIYDEATPEDPWHNVKGLLTVQDLIGHLP